MSKLGAIFRPKAPKIPVPPPPPTEADTSLRTEEERKKAAARKGRASTIISGKGLLSGKDEGNSLLGS